MLKAKALKKAYQGLAVLHEVDLSIQRGEILGLLGPNGSGKTTLLRLLCGEEIADDGQVQLEGRALHEWSPRARAKKMAVLPQEGLPSVPFTVEEVVTMGRHPHQGIWPWAGDGDRQTVERVLKDTHLLQDRARPVRLLSGGERQRVAIAKAMAQEPELLFLDEPTTYLDIAHQLAVLDHIKRWQRESGLAVLVVFHDLNLAAQYCDRLAIMKEGAILHTGAPQDVIKEAVIQEVYGVTPLIIHHPVSHVPQVILQSDGSPGQELSATVLSMRN